VSAHGTVNRYRKGCRCDLCRQAATATHRYYIDRSRARRIEVDGRLVAPVGDERHGKPSTYINEGCRCPPCADAHRAHKAAFKAKRWAARVEIDGRLTAVKARVHGRSTYLDHGCRCLTCTAAHGEYEAERRRRTA
jgi:hypothetical protein